MYNDPVYIQTVEEKLVLFKSKDRPYLITMMGSDVKSYKFILKYDQTDFWLESKFIDYANWVNFIFKQNFETCKRNIEVETYQITLLSKQAGIIEWVQNTQTVKSLIDEYAQIF